MIGRSTYKALVAIFNQQWEVSEGNVVVKAKTGGDCIQNPSDARRPTSQTPTKGEEGVTHFLAPGNVGGRFRPFAPSMPVLSLSLGRQPVADGCRLC